MKIFINPGHCVGLDIGATGYDVKVFQADDLAEIVDVSNYWDSDIFVSIQNQIVQLLTEALQIMLEDFNMEFFKQDEQ